MSRCQQSPLLKNASAQCMGQLCTPCPSACELGHHSGLWGGLGRGSRASATGFTQRCQRQSQARWPRCHLPSRSSRRDRRGPAVLKDGPAPGEPPLAPAHSRAGNSARSREQRKLFNSVTDLENVSVHPRHSWGLFLPVANAEGNASVLPQARTGHSTCTHRCRASPTSQVFHSNTGQ